MSSNAYLITHKTSVISPNTYLITFKTSICINKYYHPTHLISHKTLECDALILILKELRD